MKKFLFLCLASAGLLSACSSDSESLEVIDEGTVSVRFYLELQPDVVPFGTRVMPGGLPAEPSVVEEPPVSEPEEPIEEPAESMFSCLEYVVFDQDDRIIKHQQLKSEEGNTTEMMVADEFSPGVYQICFLAHSSSDIQLEGNNMVFPDEVSECFYYSEEFEVEIGDDMTENFTLTRVVSRVEFVATDNEIPDDITSFKVETSGIYKTFDLLYGYAAKETSAFTLTHVFTDDDREPGNAPVHAFYTFVPEGEENSLTKATLQALDAEEEPVREKEITDIPIYPNRITRYSGILYTNATDASFNLVINTDWGEAIEEDIKD